MGSIPQLSVIKGPARNLAAQTINSLFENVANGNAKENVALIFEGEKRSITKRLAPLSPVIYRHQPPPPTYLSSVGPNYQSISAHHPSNDPQSVAEFRRGLHRCRKHASQRPARHGPAVHLEGGRCLSAAGPRVSQRPNPAHRTRIETSSDHLRR